MEENTEKAEKIRINSSRIGIISLIIGISLIAISVFSALEVVSLIGLGLVFLGAIMLVIPRLRHVEPSYLITSSLPDYMTIDRLLKSIVPKNEAYNIPLCPKDVNLPENLAGLKQTVTFIPAEGTDWLAEIDDIANGKFVVDDPRGLLITSPGTVLLEKVEQKSKKELSETPVEEIGETLSYLFSELNLAKSLKLDNNKDVFSLEINDSLYGKLYSDNYKLRSIFLLGCPLVNAVACAVAKSTGKPTLMQGVKATGNAKTITATFKTFDLTFQKKKQLIENDEKMLLRRNELVELIKSSLTLIDLSFDALIAMRTRIIDWEKLRILSKNFGDQYSFTGQSIPPLNLNFQKLFFAIDDQNPNTSSAELYNNIAIIYAYFDNLSPENEIKECIPNYATAKAIISMYITINDLLLGKVVNDIVDIKEVNQLKDTLDLLSIGSDFKIDLVTIIDKVKKSIPETDLDSFIDDTRNVFKEQITLFL